MLSWRDLHYGAFQNVLMTPYFGRTIFCEFWPDYIFLVLVRLYFLCWSDCIFLVLAGMFLLTVERIVFFIVDRTIFV